ncbi:MAG TPA: ABC transporter permease, partial [Bdellovibrionota bacterium]|nr:ABC transporter permease [Bdellovibrionota bacterium]
MKVSAGAHSRFWTLARTAISVIAGFAAGLAVTWFAGEKPWHVLAILGKSAFGSWYDLGMTLFYTTPLLLTGLSVAVAFQAGLFNIGAEGQLTLGALAAAVAGIVLPRLPWPLAPLAAAAAAFGAGAFWGWIAGWLRAKRGSHEVITTIMLNFVAAGLASYATLYLFANPDSQNPETRPVGKTFLIHHFSTFGAAPVSSALFLALAAAALYGFGLKRTSVGFEIKAVGQNEHAARAAGIEPGRIQVLAMTLAGGLAGLVGVGEVLGNAEKFKLGFSPDFGFVGIAVALLGRGDPLGVVVAALLFGALHKGTGDLDFETEHVTRDLSLILQAMVIL